MKRFAALLMCFVLLTPVFAQENAPVVITAENATALRLLNRVGSALPGRVEFSPDGRYILATTSEQTYIYTADNPDAAPQIYPFTAFSFDADGFLIADGQRWNLATGLSVGVAPTIHVVRHAEDAPAVIEVVKPGGDTIRVQTDITRQIIRTAVTGDYTVLAVAEAEDYLQTPTVYLYKLPSGQRIAALPLADHYPVDRLFFTSWGEFSNLIVTSRDPFSGREGSVAFYQSDGTLRSDYSGQLDTHIAQSSDGAFAYHVNNQTVVYGTGSVIGSFDYEGRYATPFISRNGIALLDSQERAILSPIDDDGDRGDFIVLYGVNGAYFDEDHFIFFRDRGYAVFDLSQPDEPLLIIEPPHYSLRLKPDFTQYRYFEDGREIIRDVASGEIVADLPPSPVLSPDWSQAAYWDGGMLSLVDVASGERTSHVLLPDFAGRVADLNAPNGDVLFLGETLVMADVNPDDGFDYPPPEFSENPTLGAQFIGGGGCIAVFESTFNENYSDILAIYPITSEIFCHQPEYQVNTRPDVTFITPRIGYLAAYQTSCDSPYAYPSTNIYPLSGHQQGELYNILHIQFACGRYSFAFTQDEATVYYADGGLKRASLSVGEEAQLPVENMVELLRYGGNVGFQESIGIGQVFLSPDERRIALAVEEQNGNGDVTARYVEIFDIDELSEGLLRRDVYPVNTIYGATFAVFSPDGKYVVTDVGLFSVNFGNQNPAVDGTISAFSPDSRTLATVQDGFVTLWQVPQPQPTDFPLAQYAIGGVRELAFNPDGSRLYAVRDGDVQMWGVE